MDPPVPVPAAFLRALVPPEAEPLVALPEALPPGWHGASLVERFGRSFITAADILDWFEERHYWLWGAAVPETLGSLVGDLARVTGALVRPGPRHRRSCLTVLVACRGAIGEPGAAVVRAFRHRRVYRCWLHGEARTRLLVIAEDGRQLHASRDARPLLTWLRERKPGLFTGDSP